MKKSNDKIKVIVPSYKSFSQLVSDEKIYSSKYRYNFCEKYSHRFVWYPCYYENIYCKSGNLPKFRLNNIGINSIDFGRKHYDEENMNKYILDTILILQNDKYKDKKDKVNYVVTATENEKEEMSFIIDKQKSLSFKFYIAF